jgi:two-component system, OmpR family, phosphate regulon sensor histidine kinase PhoR
MSAKPRRTQRGNKKVEKERPLQNVDKLASLIKSQRAALLSRWREQVRLLPSAKHLDTPTLNDHIPALLDELATAFQWAIERTIPDALLEGSPPIHGLQRYQDGFDIVEVVAEYNILRGCVHDLAESHKLSLQGQAFHILNRVFDGAIGLAIQTFSTQQALELQRRRDEYLAFVAHDLRTPLNAISLVARIFELSQSGRDDATETARMLRTLRRNVQQIEALVEKVLKESAHVQTEGGIKPEPRVLDVWPLAESVIHDLQPVTGSASTRLINEIPEELTSYADASLLRRIIQNLLANAITYTPRGEVVIGARETGCAGAIECWVRDNGSGIPGERLGKIFDKHETDPQKPGGTGLGLAIVKTFVEAHGGKVTVETAEGAGSTFRFTLPGKATVA